MNNFRKPIRNKMIMLAVAANKTYGQIGAACYPPISRSRVEQIVKQERRAGRLPADADIPIEWLSSLYIGNPDSAPASAQIDDVMGGAA